MRAADLFNLGSDYGRFVHAILALHHEAEIHKGAPIEWGEFFPAVCERLRDYLVPMIELSPEAWDAEGRSRFHSKCMENLIHFVQKVLMPAELKVSMQFGCGSGLPDPVYPEDAAGLHIRILVDPDEERRWHMLEKADLLKSQTGGREICFVLPGREGAVPLPDGCCDIVRLSGFGKAALNEAQRILKKGGKIARDGKEEVPQPLGPAG